MSTAIALIAHPGRLTREFVAGRRERYVPPLRRCLAATFLFFLEGAPGIAFVHVLALSFTMAGLGIASVVLN